MELRVVNRSYINSTPKLGFLENKAIPRELAKGLISETIR